jgi:hypothetical protein
MNRRSFLAALGAAAGALVLPEPQRVRAYSFMPGVVKLPGSPPYGVVDPPWPWPQASAHYYADTDSIIIADDPAGAPTFEQRRELEAWVAKTLGEFVGRGNTVGTRTEATLRLLGSGKMGVGFR